MSNIESWLEGVAKSLEPSPSSRTAAARSQKHLREKLSTGQMEGRLVGDYLSGSYARNTAIHPLGDVDIIFLIDPTRWKMPLFSFADKPAPSDVLKSFAAALRWRYKQTSAFTQRRSIRLELYHLHIDCVPAIAIEGTDYIWVGDRDDDKWIKSSPKHHEVAVTAANRQNKGLLKPLIKILKFWNRNLPSTTRVRSFVIETIAVTLFSKVPFKSLEEGVFLFFDFVANFKDGGHLIWKDKFEVRMDRWNVMVVPDLAMPSRNVAGGVDTPRMVKFRDCAIKSRDGIAASRSSRSADVALKRWSSVLRMPKAC